jgi:DNA phosphorothioation-associated putative methyltransferase
MINRGKTAIYRNRLSKPTQLAVESSIINNTMTVFDNGCGHGKDVELLGELGYTVAGYDLVHFSNNPKIASDVVLSNYVCNVIENVEERTAYLQECWKLADKLLIVAVRNHTELKGIKHYTVFGDGILTSENTFQKLYTKDEFIGFLKDALGNVKIEFLSTYIAVVKK